MKQLFTLVLFSLSLIGFGQESSIKKHEIGLNLYSFNNGYIAVTDDYDSYFIYAIQHAYLNGLSYRLRKGNNAFRFSAQYQYEKLPDFATEFKAGQLYWGKMYNIEGRLGYEHAFGKGKLHPFLFADLVFNYGYTNGTSGSYIGPTISPVTSEIKNYNYGVSPGVGIAYQVFPMISFRIETNISAGYYLQNGKPIYGFPEATFGKYSEGGYFQFNPISTCSVNFHF